MVESDDPEFGWNTDTPEWHEDEEWHPMYLMWFEALWFPPGTDGENPFFSPNWHLYWERQRDGELPELW